MKILIIGLACIALSAGCVSSTAPKVIVPLSDAQIASNIVEPIIQGSVPLFLDRNPSYAPAIVIVADGIPAAFAAGTLTPESIASAVHLINVRAALGLSADVETLIANGLSIAVTQYQQQAGVKVAAATDPGIQLVLTSFATGLHNGVTTWQSAHK